MPKDYNKTIIYRIPVGDENYYGHTTQPLHKRKCEHKKHFKKQPNRKVYKALRDANMTENDIELIWVEDYPCRNIYEAKAKERYWIENGGTLNANVPNRTTKERYATDADYMQKNKQRAKQWTSDKWRNDAEFRYKYLERQRTKYRTNEEYRKKVKADRRDYMRFQRDNEERRAQINEKKKEKVECCMCGKHISRGHMSRHQKQNCKDRQTT